MLLLLLLLLLQLLLLLLVLFKQPIFQTVINIDYNILKLKKTECTSVTTYSSLYR